MLKIIAKELKELLEYPEIFIPFIFCICLIFGLLFIALRYNPHATIKRAFFSECLKPKNKAQAIDMLRAEKGRLFEVQINDESNYYYLPKDTELKAGDVIITQYILDDKFLHEITELANFTEYVKGGRTHKKNAGGYTIK